DLEEAGPPLAEAPERVGQGGRVHAGVEDQLAPGVNHQVAADGHRPARPRCGAREEARDVEVDVAPAERVDLQHVVGPFRGRPMLSELGDARKAGFPRAEWLDSAYVRGVRRADGAGPPSGWQGVGR